MQTSDGVSSTTNHSSAFGARENPVARIRRCVPIGAFLALTKFRAGSTCKGPAQKEDNFPKFETTVATSRKDATRLEAIATRVEAIALSLKV